MKIKDTVIALCIISIISTILLLHADISDKYFVSDNSHRLDVLFGSSALRLRVNSNEIYYFVNAQPEIPDKIRASFAIEHMRPSRSNNSAWDSTSYSGLGPYATPMFVKDSAPLRSLAVFISLGISMAASILLVITLLRREARLPVVILPCVIVSIVCRIYFLRTTYTMIEPAKATLGKLIIGSSTQWSVFAMLLQAMIAITITIKLLAGEDSRGSRKRAEDRSFFDEADDIMNYNKGVTRQYTQEHEDDFNGPPGL